MLLWLRLTVKVKLLLERYCRDWDGLSDQMKRSFTYKEVSLLHQHCAMFLHFLSVLESTLPRGLFPAAREKLMNVFMLGGMDSELKLQSESTVPPGDLRGVGAFRTCWATFF